MDKFHEQKKQKKNKNKELCEYNQLTDNNNGFVATKWEKID